MRCREFSLSIVFAGLGATDSDPEIAALHIISVRRNILTKPGSALSSRHYARVINAIESINIAFVCGNLTHRLDSNLQ